MLFFVAPLPESKRMEPNLGRTSTIEAIYGPIVRDTNGYRAFHLDFTLLTAFAVRVADRAFRRLGSCR